MTFQYNSGLNQSSYGPQLPAPSGGGSANIPQFSSGSASMGPTRSDLIIPQTSVTPLSDMFTSQPGRYTVPSITPDIPDTLDMLEFNPPSYAEPAVPEVVQAPEPLPSALELGAIETPVGESTMTIPGAGVEIPSVTQSIVQAPLRQYTAEKFAVDNAGRYTVDPFTGQTVNFVAAMGNVDPNGVAALSGDLERARSAVEGTYGTDASNVLLQDEMLMAGASGLAWAAEATRRGLSVGSTTPGRVSRGIDYARAASAAQNPPGTTPRTPFARTLGHWSSKVPVGSIARWVGVAGKAIGAGLGVYTVATDENIIRPPGVGTLGATITGVGGALGYMAGGGIELAAGVANYTTGLFTDNKGKIVVPDSLTARGWAVEVANAGFALFGDSDSPVDWKGNPIDRTTTRTTMHAEYVNNLSNSGLDMTPTRYRDLTEALNQEGVPGREFIDGALEVREATRELVLLGVPPDKAISLARTGSAVQNILDRGSPTIDPDNPSSFISSATENYYKEFQEQLSIVEREYQTSLKNNGTDDDATEYYGHLYRTMKSVEPVAVGAGSEATKKTLEPVAVGAGSEATKKTLEPVAVGAGSEATKKTLENTYAMPALESFDPLRNLNGMTTEQSRQEWYNKSVVEPAVKAGKTPPTFDQAMRTAVNQSAPFAAKSFTDFYNSRSSDVYSRAEANELVNAWARSQNVDLNADGMGDFRDALQTTVNAAYTKQEFSRNARALGLSVDTIGEQIIGLSGSQAAESLQDARLQLASIRDESVARRFEDMVVQPLAMKARQVDPKEWTQLLAENSGAIRLGEMSGYKFAQDRRDALIDQYSRMKVKPEDYDTTLARFIADARVVNDEVLAMGTGFTDRGFFKNTNRYTGESEYNVGNILMGITAGLGAIQALYLGPKTQKDYLKWQEKQAEKNRQWQQDMWKMQAAFAAGSATYQGTTSNKGTPSEGYQVQL